MISTKSMTVFIGLNTFLLCLAAIQETLINNIYIFKVFLIFISRNYLLLGFINKLSNEKKYISNNALIIPKEEYKYEFDVNVICSAIIETASHIVINAHHSFNEDNIYVDLVYFVPISFLFELFFDLLFEL